MRSFFSKSRYNLASHIAIWSALVHFSTCDYCYTQNMYGSFLGAISSGPQEDDEAKYTVNFNNVSVIEVIRFVSKISGSNFVFAENELQFNVTIISEEPISAKNFISALIQVLRINGMKLLEQEGNFLITSSSSDVNQIPTIVSGDIPGSLQTSAPIVTRVFRIKNANIASLAGILRPLTSKGSLIEIAEQTKQLIITDITTNIDKIAILLQSLDTPHSNFEIESYKVKHIYPPDIISLTQTILEPFLNGTTLLFVPQIEANTVFIISTPYLIERALAVMEDVDVPAQLKTIGTGPNTINSVFFAYPIQKGNAKQIKAALSDFALKAQDITLQAAVDSCQWIQETNSLVFMVPSSLIPNLQTLLSALDSSKIETQIYCYKILNAKAPQIESSLQQMAQTIRDSAFTDVVQNLKWIEESNTLVFSGSAEALAKLPPILAALDVANSKDNIYIYQIQNIPEVQIEDSLQKMMGTIQDPDLINAIKSLKWIKESNQLIFNGSLGAINKLKDLLPTLDVSDSSPHIYMYKVVHAPKKQIIAALQILANTTQNKDLADAIKELKWIDDSNTLVFRSTPSTITKLQTLLTTLDTASPELQLYMYKVRNTPKDQVLAKLKQMASTIQEKDLLEAIQNATLIPESNTIMFHATPAVNTKLQNILSTLDVKDQELQLYTYKALHASEKQITASLKHLAKTIKNKELSDAIDQMEWIEESNTFMFHASQSAIDKLQTLLPSLDSSGSDLQLRMYKIHNTSNEQMTIRLKQLEDTVQDKALLAAIKGCTIIPESGTLLFHATSTVNKELQDILSTLDVKGGDFQLYTYKLEHASKKQITASLQQLANTMQNKALSTAISQMTWSEESHTIIFYASQETTDKLKTLIPTLDVAGSDLGLHIYKIHNASSEQMTARLQQVTSTIQDKEILDAIKNSTLISESGTLLFHATSSTYAKLQEILSTLDVKGEESQLYMYKLEHTSKKQITASLQQLSNTMQNKELSNAVSQMKWIPESNTLMFYAAQATLDKLKTILPTLDVAGSTLQLYMYKIQNASKEQLTTELENMTDTIQDKELLNAFKTIALIPDSNTLMFHATPAAHTKLQNILTTLDVKGEELQFCTYKIEHAPKEQLFAKLEQMTGTVQDKALLNAIKSASLIPDSNTLMFHATPATNAKMQSLLATLDVSGPELQLYMVKIQNVSKKQITSSLGQLASTIKNKDLSDAISQMKWIEESNTIMFHATPGAIDTLKAIIPSLDVSGPELQLYAYKIHNASSEQVMTRLQQMTSTIQDKALLDTIKNITLIPESNTLVFHTTSAINTKLQHILSTVDVKGEDLELYIYKIEHASKKQLTNSLQQLASTMQNKDLSSAVAELKWIEESNTFMFHATPATVANLKTILPTLDVAGSTLQLYMYKIQNASKEQLTTELENMTNTIQDKELLNAFKTIALIPDSNTLMFHATPAAHTKLQNILTTLDVKGEELQFCTYKIEHVPKEQLFAKLEQMTGTVQDKALLNAIKNASLIPDSNTLMFHATPATNAKMQSLLATLDVSGPELQLYMVKIQNVSKKQITSSLGQLASTIKNKDLSDAISQMKWIEESNTLMFHATPGAIDTLKALLPSLDVSGPELQLYAYKIRNASSEQVMTRLQQMTSTIQDKALLDTIKNITLIPESNTLVFHTTSAINTKLQHILSTVDVKGEDLELYIYKIEHSSKKQLTNALQQLASTMQNKDLSTAVAELKWIEESNTFMFHATPATVAKLKTILPTLDVGSQVQVYSYIIKHASSEQITTRLKQVASTIQDKELLDAIKTSSLVPESNTLIFNATPSANTKLQNLLTTLDVKSQESQLHLYKVLNTSSEQIIDKLKQMSDTIQNKELLDAINSINTTSGNNTLAFHATPAASIELQNILTTLDSKGPELQLYMYKVLHAPQKQLTSSLQKIASSIQDKELSDTINQMHWISENNTIMFHATPAIIAKLQTILFTLDAGGHELQPFTYNIKNASKEQMLSRLDDTAGTIQNTALSTAIRSAAFIPGSNTLIFYATPAINTQLQTIMMTLDVAGQQLYMYQIKNAPYKQIAASLDQLTDILQSKELSDAVSQMKWIEKSNTIMFHTSPDTIAKLQSILPTLDITGPELQLHMYKIQNGSKEQIMAKLKQMSATIQDKDLLAAIQGATLISESNTLIFHATTSVNAQIQNILATLDVTDSQLQIYMYKIQHISQEQITASLKQLASTIQNKDLSDAISQMKWIEKSNTLMFNAIPSTIAKLQDILTTLDVAGPERQLYMYKILHAPKEDVLARLKQMTSTIQDKELLDAIQSASVMPDSNTLIFHATPTANTKIQSILSTLDVIGLQLYMYKIQNVSKDQLMSSLKQLTGTIQNKDLSDAIDQMKWIQESNTLMFHATPIAIEKLQTLLPSLDVKVTGNHFLLYNPKNQTGEELQKNLEELSQSLKSSGLQNTPLLEALNSMKWVASSNSLIFTGDTASTDRILVILQNLDVPLVNNAPFNVFVFKPTHASQKQMQTALTYYAQNLNPTSDQQLIQAISSAEWIPETLSFLFKSNADTWTELQKVLTSLDNSKSFADTQANTFYLYKLQNIPGNILIQDLKALADSLPSEDPKSSLIITAIKGLKWVKENNSVLITGSPSAIDQLKTIIVDFDTNFQSKENQLSPKSEFFIYKHQNLSAEEIKDALKNLAQDLSSSEFANADLIHTLQTVSIVSSTGSLLFTGTVDSLAKVKALLLSVDSKEPTASTVQSIGSTVFLIYKIKQAPAQELLQALQNFATHLTQADVEDKALEQSLSSVKWIKETNSLLFTGPQATLEKAEKLAEKFDIGTITTPRAAPSSFVVYVPRVQTGEALITILSEFMQNLVQSEVADPDLFDSIKHLKFIEKTNSLIISGTPASIQKIQELLVKFDKEGAENSTIESIDASSFLIYKLQYHPGIEILSALKKVASSLAQSAPEANKALIDAVDSLQWIEITNSLLGTGTPEVLGKIRELILSLDVPLRQVFIEVLVVETSLFNSQNFGLQWGSQLQYLNKTIGAIGNFPSAISNFANGTNTGSVNLGTPINNSTNLNTPVQGNPNTSITAVPFSTGFDLGVIGDILFHKGQSFISLGSLLNALQVDNDTTVVMNPKLITQDGHTSNIFVGQNIPFVGSFVSNTASNTVQSSNIEYRDVGVNLTITPTLGTNNIITLDINQDISEQTTNSTNIQGSQVTGIQTNHTTMNTRVHVPDRHFLVLSGMIQDTKTHFRSGIPCLGGLPIIGALFSENDRLNTKANIIIFLRPFIIDSFEDYDNITAAEEDLYKEQAGLQDLKEEFDAGTEMIKDLNNG